MDVGGAKGGLKADINVTPLVDVMLVLLIIVMLIAPMLQKGVDITLPVADNSGDKPDTNDQTVVAIDAQSRLYVNMVETSEADVIPRLQGILEQVNDKIVYSSSMAPRNETWSQLRYSGRNHSTVRRMAPIRPSA
jgi:biopolymer transport protein ExbD